jgi:hypothetical protein
MSEEDKPAEPPEVEPEREVDGDPAPSTSNRKWLAVGGVIAAAAIAATAVIALSGSSKGSDQDQIRSTFEKAATSLADGNGKEFCSTLTSEAEGSFTSQISTTTGAPDCAEGVTNLLKSTKALAAGDWKVFCATIGQRAASSIANAGPSLRVAKTCEAAAAAVSETATGKKAFESLGQQLNASLDRLKSGKLATVKISGTTATAALANATATDRPIKFEKVNGEWKIAQ